jgi:hypothetical protein
MPPETRYAKSGDVNIAYRVVGDGPFDLVYVPGWVSNIELLWEKPKPARFLERPGVVLPPEGPSSTPLGRTAPRYSDIRRAAACPSASSQRIPSARVRSSLSALFAKRVRTDDYLATIGEVERHSGTGLDNTDYAPHGDPALLEWHSTCLRRAQARSTRGMSFRPFAFRCSSSPGPAIGRSRLTRVAGSRHRSPTCASSSFPATSICSGRGTGTACSRKSKSSSGAPARRLITTEHAREHGDRGWHEVLDEHHARVRGVRAGLHTGECELMRDKIGGIAVHTGARVAAAADPGEVLVSSKVKDLVAGSGIVFVDRRERELKGVGSWRLYSVLDA